MKTNAFKRHFQELYSHQPTAVAVAPGRVNLIGEHTDYNAGFVLPCALGFATQVAFRARQDKIVRVTSVNYSGEQVSFNLDAQLVPTECHWANYVIGVYYAFQHQGHHPMGADLLIYGDVPQGAGLSSSAALEVAVAAAINEQNEFGFGLTDLALIGQFTENKFLGCQTGIMDQMISAHGKAGHALLLDCNDLSNRHISIPDNLKLLIVNSNFKRELVGSEYNQRRLECEGAAAKLNVSSLRHADTEQLAAYQSQLTSNEFKRASHIVSEIQRTLDAAESLTTGDFDTLRQLMYASHASLKDDFEVTVPATDCLVDIVRKHAGSDGGARMTGGGFGGAIVALLKPEVVAKVISAIEYEYPRRFDLAPSIYQCDIGDGLRMF